MKDPRNLVIVVLVAVAAYLAGSSGGGSEALGQVSSGNANQRMVAVTGLVGSGVSVLWVIDTESGQLAVYRSSGGKSIELVGARKIEWDFRIEEFHDESVYSPEDLRKRFRAGAEDDPGKGKED
jgi:hypothetical protein